MKLVCVKLKRKSPQCLRACIKMLIDFINFY